MIKIKNLIINILIPNIVGFLSAILSKVSDNIDTFNKPSWNPPGIVFPIGTIGVLLSNKALKLLFSV